MFLNRHQIGFHYEYPLALMDGDKLRIYYPDFTLPRHGLILEYFGMEGNPDYDIRSRHKLAAYRAAGIDGIYLNPESFRGDWPTRLWGQIEGHLAGRLDKFREHRQPCLTERKLPYWQG